MSATLRHAGALSLMAALLFGNASHAGASEIAAVDRNPRFAVDFTLGAVPPIVPAMTAGVLDLSPAPVPEPSPIADAVQSRPIDLGVARKEISGFGSSTLRRSLYVSFGALQVLDAVSTRHALSAGAQEANPAMAGIVKSNTGLIAVKAGTALATTYFVEKLAEKHPRRAAIVMTVINAAYVGIVAHNYRVARNSR